MINSTSSHRTVGPPPAPTDHWLIATVITLTIIGLLMVASASIVVSDHQWHQPFYFFYRQLISLAIGIGLGAVVVQCQVNVWEKIGGALLLITLLSLALVLFPGIGHTVNGSSRWLGIGPFRIQVSEFAKFAVIVYMAGYLFRRQCEIQTQLSGFLKPIAILGIVTMLLLREPDFGASVVILSTTLGMMFLAGMRLRHFLLLFAGLIIVIAILAISQPYRIHRLTSFLNPWANAYNSGYQLTQALIAFGRGGLFGVGLGKSIQKLFYLPEAHTDFVFAVIAEEFGLLGTLLMIGLFVFLVIRIFLIGRKAQQLHQHFAGFLAYGLGLWIMLQFVVSVGVNSGLLPTKGLTLPFVSYGGNSILIYCIAIALILRIDYENRMIALGLRDANTD